MFRMRGGAFEQDLTSNLLREIVGGSKTCFALGDKKALAKK